MCGPRNGPPSARALRGWIDYFDLASTERPNYADVLLAEVFAFAIKLQFVLPPAENQLE
jgi:hypothetical protein